MIKTITSGAYEFRIGTEVRSEAAVDYRKDYKTTPIWSIVSMNQRLEPKVNNWTYVSL